MEKTVISMTSALAYLSDINAQFPEIPLRNIQLGCAFR